MTTPWPGVTQVMTSQASASASDPARQPSSSASRSAAAASASWQTPGPYPAAARHRAAQAPLTPQPMTAAEPVAVVASAVAATAATAPVRSAVTAPASRIASGSLVVASLSTRTPITVGRPWAGLPGNDEIHLSIASSPPRAGIARKSPWGGLCR